MIEPQSERIMRKSRKSLHSITPTVAQDMGWINIPILPYQPLFQLTILVGSFITYCCITADFAYVVSKYLQDVHEPLPTIHSTLEDLIYCFDGFNLVDLVLTIVYGRFYQRSTKFYYKPRGSVIITLELILLVPYEAIYFCLNGTMPLVYFGLRLRYVGRLYRYVSYLKRSRGKYKSVGSIISLYIMTIIVICATATSTRLMYRCGFNSQEENLLINCSNPGLFDYLFTFFKLNGQTTNVDMILLGTPYSTLESFVALFQFMVFYYATLVNAKLTCCFIEKLKMKYSFAITTYPMLSHLYNVRRSIGDRWMYVDDIYIRYLKRYLAVNMDKWDLRQRISFEVESNNLPEAIRREISLEACWNAFKHSELFKDEDVHFLRYLSSLATYSYVTDGEPIFRMGEFKSKMVYIVNGAVHVLSEKDSLSAVISLTGGTCLGEASLYVDNPSPVYVVCQTYCEYVMLTKYDYCKVSAVYPEVHARLKKTILQRLATARIYDAIGKRVASRAHYTTKSEVSLRYIKDTLELHMNGFQETDFFSSYDAKWQSLYSEAIFCPDYLSMYVPTNQTAVFRHLVKSGIQFKLNPRSLCLFGWNTFMLLVVPFTSILIPLLIIHMIEENHYGKFGSMLTTISGLYFIDMLVQCMTAVETKDGFRTEFEFILRSLLAHPVFWVDCIAFLPLEFIVNSIVGPLPERTHCLFYFNRVLKAIKYIVHLDEKCSSKSINLVYVTILKCLYVFILTLSLVYFVAMYVEYQKYTGFEPGTELMKMVYSFCWSFQFMFGSAAINITVDRTLPFLPLILIQYGWCMIKLNCIPQLHAAVSLHLTNSMEYETFAEDCRRMSALFRLNVHAKKKLFKYLHFHYLTDYGWHILRAKHIPELVGNTLYRGQKSIMFREILRNEGLFKELPNHILRDIGELAKLILIPRYEYIIYAGMLPHDIYIIVEGICGYVNGYGRIVQRLLPGTALVVLEALRCSSVVYNIVTLTDCKLLSINSDKLRGKFAKYPLQAAIVNETIGNMDQHDDRIVWLDEMQTEEYNGSLEVDEVIKSFRLQVKPEEMVQRIVLKYVVKYFFLHRTINPQGAFWFYWEISRCCFAYIQCFLGGIGILPIVDYGYVWFYVFRFLDLTAYVDMYLRQHVIYFNKDKIEVSHPWCTAKNYWSTSFAVDCIASFPFDWVLSSLNSPASHLGIFLCANRYLQLYRFYGLKKYITETYMSHLRHLDLLIYALFQILLCNFYVGLIVDVDCMYYHLNHTMACPISSDISMRAVTAFWYSYLIAMLVALRNFVNIGMMRESMTGEGLFKFCAFTLVGFVVLTYFSCKFVGTSLFRNPQLPIFQMKMRRIVYFMSTRKIDKALRTEIINHYEHLWALREGKSLRAFVGVFTKNFFSDIIMNQYEALYHSIIFRGYPTAIFKDLLINAGKRQMILITGVIIRVNDIHDNIFIITKGEVDVCGPDLTILETLQAGSLFGCLDATNLTRSTLTYVAKTHCEVITLQCDTFYNTIKKHPSFQKHFGLLLSRTNMDYIESKRAKLGVTIPKPPKTHWTQQKPTTQQRRNKWHFYFLRRIFRTFKPSVVLVRIFLVYYVVAFTIDCFLSTLRTSNLRIVAVVYLLDAIFLFKIYMEFSTGYENNLGYYVNSRKLIALRYLRNPAGFALDVLCILPFEIIPYVCFSLELARKYSCYARSNRLIKIVYVFRYLKSVNNRLNVNVYASRAAFVLMLIYTVQQLSIIIIVLAQDIQNMEGIFNRYMAALSIQIYFLSVGIYGNTTHIMDDVWFMIAYILIMIVTRFVSIVVFAECCASYQIMNTARVSYESFQFNKRTEMARKGVSKMAYERISGYMFNLSTRGYNVQVPVFVSQAPRYLREALLNSMFGFHLRRHPIFKECHSDLIRQMAYCLVTRYFYPDDYITFKGDNDELMFFIHEGIVVGLDRDDLLGETVAVTLQAGEFFGFLQLFVPRIGQLHTYKAVSDVIILMLSRKQITELLQFFPASKYIIDKSLQTRGTSI